MSNFTKQVPLRGRRAYLTEESELVAKGGFVGGGEALSGNTAGGIVLPSADKVVKFDDFTGDVVGDEWAYVEGDTGHAGAIVESTNGVFRLTASDSVATLTHASNHALTGGLIKNWKAHQGKGGAYGSLRFSARVKLESVSRTLNRQHVFVGLSDTGGAEMPIYDTGGGLQANAADLVGFLFSPGGDTGWSFVSVQGGGTAQVVAVDTGVTAGEYDVLEFEVKRGGGDTGGSAYAYVNGVAVGKISNPITGTVALSEWVGQFVQDTGGGTVDIDYVNVSAPRDTGN